MTTAQRTDFKGPSLQALAGLKAEVVAKVDAIEDHSGLDGAASFRGNSKATKRVFLAETPACTRPAVTIQAPDQSLLNELATLFSTADASTPAKIKTLLEKAMPEMMAMIAPEKMTALMQVLNRVCSPAKKSSDQDAPSGDLFDYLTALMLFQVSTAQSQTKIAGINQTISDAAVKVSQAAEKKASDSFNAFMADEASKQTSSFWSTFLSIASVFLGSVVFLATGSPMLLAMALIGVITANVPVNGETLDQRLSDQLESWATSIVTDFCKGGTPPAGWVSFVKDVLFAGVAIAETMVFGKFEEALDSSVQTAAKVTTVVAEAGESVAANIARDVQLTAENAANEVANGINKANLWTRRAGKLLMAVSTNGPLLPSICQQIALAVYPNDKNGQTYFAMALQLALGLIGSIGGGYMNGYYNGPSLMAKLAGTVGERTARTTILVMKAMQSLTNIGGAGFELETASFLKDEQTTFQDQADARFSLACANSIIQTLQTIGANTTDAFKGVYTDFADMNQSVGERLDPWNPQNWAV